jgi:hypothetical protein
LHLHALQRTTSTGTSVRTRTSSLLADLPSIDRFPTVDEMHAFAMTLASNHPDQVTLREVGRSRAGDAIQLLSIRPQRARGDLLVIGQPHPNEPIGMATIKVLGQRLLADPDALNATGINWHFIPCADPDGTRLNEGWFAGPFTREHYSRHFYRPGGETQVEWTFPFSTDGFSVDKPLPETVALMAAIDEVRPTVMASLHNAELGGAYFYAHEGGAPFYQRLIALCEEQDIPLHVGEPEFPLSTVFATAIYSVPTADQMHQLALALGIDPAAVVTGRSSLDYARKYREPVGVVVELPYWRDDRAADVSEDSSGRSRRDIVVNEIDAQAGSTAKIRNLFDQAAPLPPSPFSDAVRSFLELEESGYGEERRQQALTDPDYNRPATVAEAFSIRDDHHAARLRLLGMLLRGLPDGAPVSAECGRLFDEWCDEAAAFGEAEVIPIRNLVAVQAGAILAAVDFAASRSA